MVHNTPTFHDAELVLRVYELRRETVMRQSRDAINQKFLPRSYEEFIAVTSKLENPLNAAWRQVSSYWEMVYSFAHAGAVNAEFFVDNNGEGLFLFAKVAPFLERFRKEGSPTAFQHTEWAATQTETGKRRFAMARMRIEQMMSAPQK